MELPVEEKTILKTYSDLPDNSFSLPCYSLSEVLIEKMAALMGRTEARDLYDFWYLVEVDGLDMSQHAIGFENKAKHKNHDPKEFGSKVLKKAGIFERDWETKLKHQMHDLPNFDDVMRKVKKYLK